MNEQIVEQVVAPTISGSRLAPDLQDELPSLRGRSVRKLPANRGTLTHPGIVQLYLQPPRSPDAASMFACANVSKYVSIQIHVSKIYVYIYIHRMYIRVYIYTHIYVYVYIHMHSCV